MLDPLVYQLEVHYAGSDAKVPISTSLGTLAENAASLRAVPETMARAGLKAVLLTGHTAIDYAHVLRDISDTHFADAKIITLLQDNLNIHVKSSLCEAFPAAEARRLVNRFEWVHTPKHGSWLDLAESELAVLTSQCLDQRIPDHRTLIREVGAWVKHRNLRHAKADWRFTTDDARIKLKHLYPYPVL
jgi:DDE superfamily endonuclease